MASAATLAGLAVLGALLATRVARSRTCSPRVPATFALILFFALGALRLAPRLDEADRGAVRRTFDATVEARVCATRHGVRGASVELCDAVAVVEGGPAMPRRLLVGATAGSPAATRLRALAEGERVRLRLRVRPTRGLRNPGGRAHEVALRRRGIGARARLTDPLLVVQISGVDGSVRVPAATRGSAALDALRLRIGDRLIASGAGGALLAALGVGDRRFVSETTRSAFGELGIAHLLAVSGLHLVLVVGLGYAGFLAALVRIDPFARRLDVRLPALWLAFGMGCGYAMLCGFEIPVRRALVFMAAVVLGLRLGRRLPAANVLAIAAIVILASEPHALFEVGAQLSFVAVAALLIASGEDGHGPVEGSRVLAAIRRSMRATLRTTAAVVAATAPVLALHGIPAGLWALAMNGIAVPWTAFVLLPAALVASLTSGLPESAILSLTLRPLEWLARVSLIAAERMAEWLPGWPPAPPPTPGVLALAAALALAATLSRRTSLRVVLAACVGGLLQLAPPRSIDPLPPRVVMFDVGQGDSILVQGRSGVLLIDAGRAIPGGIDLGRSVVVPALVALQATEIDVMVATHADLDHRGGLLFVLERMTVAELWLPDMVPLDDGFRELVASARARGVRVRHISVESGVQAVGDIRVQPLWPPPGWHSASRNEGSLVLMIELEGMRLLATGDLGAEAERALIDRDNDLAADLLKVAHHGSRTSSTSDFLAAVAPELALVSAPCGSSGGLPAPEALDRLSQWASEIRWTGRDGAVIVGIARGPDRRESGARPHVSGIDPRLQIRTQAERRSCETPLPGPSPAFHSRQQDP